MNTPSAEAAKKLSEWAGKRPINTPETSKSPLPDSQVCPSCQKNYRKGELVCPHCAFVFDRSGRTGFVGNNTLTHQKSMPTGEVSLPDQMPIVLEIDGKAVTLPPRELLIVGRKSQVDGDVQPDVALNDYDAELHGVSRHHVRIKRKGGLIFVTDLGSTNGTYLNGRKMTAQSERLLRSGDEIHLGRMKVVVRF